MKILISVLVILGVAGFLMIKKPLFPPEQSLPKQTTGTVKVEQESKWSLPPQQGLPPAVEGKRQEIAKAAYAQDYKALASLATKNTLTTFTFSFGESVDFEAFLMEKEKDGDNPQKIIPQLLITPYEKNGNEEIGYTYYWPKVFGKNSEDWTADDMAILRIIATEKEIESYREFGGYIGYRIGIKEDGTWTVYVAGD